MAIGSTPALNIQSSPYAAFVRDALESRDNEDRANQARIQAETQVRQQADSRSRATPPAGTGTNVDITV